MSQRIRRFTARELEALLRRCGFELISQRGSHRKWRNAQTQTQAQVIVPAHQGRDLPTGTLRAILRESGIPESEWRS
jgi:predicted RNA binding protein YcfA (HicA-like mRNA interferase family)